EEAKRIQQERIYKAQREYMEDAIEKHRLHVIEFNNQQKRKFRNTISSYIKHFNFDKWRKYTNMMIEKRRIEGEKIRNLQMALRNSSLDSNISSQREKLMKMELNYGKQI